MGRRVRAALGMIYAAEEAAKMAGEDDAEDGEDLQRPTKCGELSFRAAARGGMYPPNNHHHQ